MSSQDNMNMSALAMRANRYSDAVMTITSAITNGMKLNDVERQRFANAYKNTLTKMRYSWFLVSSEKHKNNSDEKLATILEYQNYIKEQIRNTCRCGVILIDYYLIADATTAEIKLFYYKNKCDYYKYLAEVANEEDKPASLNVALQEYIESYNSALTELSPINTVRLELALNFSEFYYDALDMPKEALELAQQTLNYIKAENGVDIDNLPKDSAAIIQQMKLNIEEWLTVM